jgi:eukaryotic-like serine/threonine-protein kinase
MIGTRLGNWVIDEELGRGAMGRVYLAHRDASAGTTGPSQAAVKVLAPNLAQELDFVQRFEREIEALRQLDHPNIIRFYESGAQDGYCYYAMEYVAAPDCAQLLREQGRMPWKDVLGLAVQVCAALKHAHDHGVIHRDIKPHNLLRTDDGAVKLADFGVARVFASRQLTSTGALIGTAEYASPEQAASKPVTVRSDLYSFGATLYRLLTGRTPFHGETAVEVLHQHRFAQFERPQRLVPEIPAELDQIVCNLLEKEPGRRPASALVLLRQLEDLRSKLERKEQGTVAVARERLGDDNLDFEVAAGVRLHSPARPAPGGSEQGPRDIRLGRRLVRVAVMVGLLALCGGLVLWSVWPTSSESLFQHGAALMASDNPADWDLAWSKYFERLERKYPGHPYAEQLAAYRQRMQGRQQPGKEAPKQTAADRVEGEAQLFYLRGRQLRKEGDLLGAQLIWQNLVWAFAGVESEEKWVSLAKKSLTELRQQLPPPETRLAMVRQALQRLRRPLDDDGERQLRAIEYLYRNDPIVLEEVKKFRSGKDAGGAPGKS